jgi:hypothetical protein
MPEISESPRIFENGTITLVINPDGFRLCVNTLEIDHIQSIKIDLNRLNKPDISIILGDGTPLEIDETMRVIKTLPWLKIM